MEILNGITLEILIVLAVTVGAVFLFATEKLSVDLVAVLVMATLLALGIINADEGISGFSNKATITVAAMFIISAGLFKTGAVSYLGKITSDIFKRNYWLGLVTVMIAAYSSRRPASPTYIGLSNRRWISMPRRKVRNAATGTPTYQY